MPRSFIFGFYGGNPRVDGVAKHHNELNGVFESIDATNINLIETAITEVASGVIDTQQALNSVITWMNTNLQQGPFFPDASGVLEDASGNLPALL